MSIKDKKSSNQPSTDDINGLLLLYTSGKYDQAEERAVALTSIYPRHPFSWKVLGALYNRKGKLSDALVAMKKSVLLSPQDCEAHNNLSNAYRRLGKLKEAELHINKALTINPQYAEAYNNQGNILFERRKIKEAQDSYGHAIALNPSYAEAHNNLGNLQEQNGCSEEAEINLKQAIALNPKYSEAYNNLGHLLARQGRKGEAISAYIQAINLRPTYNNAQIGLASALRGVRLDKLERQLYPILANLLTTGNFVRPVDLSDAVISLLRLEPEIKVILDEQNQLDDINGALSMINCLSSFRLIHDFMRVCPVPDLDFERVFAKARRVLLTNAKNLHDDESVLDFLSSLALQCFINEHIYFEDESESRLVGELENRITTMISSDTQPPVVDVLCLACYRALHKYDWINNLSILDDRPAVRSILIEEPLAERLLVKSIPAMQEITDPISLRVKAQYEENPYPRWVKMHLPKRSRSIAEWCEKVQIKFSDSESMNSNSSDMLIAGCGTGQHAISAASRFSNCNAMAVDLSYSSLAYAQRKAKELGVTNLQFIQADILDLGGLKKKYDVIECAGVLHHMNDPMAGWKVITGLLKNGGLMKIGLYSELARAPIAEMRKEMASPNFGISSAEIRKYRQDIIRSSDSRNGEIKSYFDFYSLSMVRDLLFHVKEHRFSLQQIKSCLETLGLRFCGFESPEIKRSFIEHHGPNSDVCDLDLWHQLELAKPRTFYGMYQFWCQRIGS